MGEFCLDHERRDEQLESALTASVVTLARKTDTPNVPVVYGALVSRVPTWAPVFQFGTAVSNRTDRALRADSDDRTVTVADEPVRVDLLDVLDVIEADPQDRFSECLAKLREALQDPIIGGKF
jgi:hypothetical protein